MALIFEELQREWLALALDRRAARSLRDVCESFGVANLLELERLVVGSGPAEADAVLVVLARRAAGGDGLAGRVLLQLLLPGVRVLARKWWALGDSDERASAILAAVWGRIRRYPIERRPGRIAANVLMDAAADLRRLARRRDPARPVGFAAREEPAAAVPVLAPALELVEVLVEAVQAGVVTREEAELIASTRIQGVRLADIAVERGMKLRTLQLRRQRAEEALVALAA